MNSKPIKDVHVLRYQKIHTRRQQQQKRKFGNFFLSVLHDQTSVESL